MEVILLRIGCAYALKDSGCFNPCFYGSYSFTPCTLGIDVKKMEF